MLNSCNRQVAIHCRHIECACSRQCVRDIRYKTIVGAFIERPRATTGRPYNENYLSFYKHRICNADAIYKLTDWLCCANQSAIILFHGRFRIPSSLHPQTRPIVSRICKRQHRLQVFHRQLLCEVCFHSNPKAPLRR